MALLEKGVEFDTVLINLLKKPEWCGPALSVSLVWQQK